MIVSLANSVRFIVNDGLDPHFGNTLFNDEDFYGIRKKSYCQKYISGDTLLVQIKGTLTETVTLTKYNSSGTSSTISASDTYTYSAFKIYDYEITIGASDNFYLVATSDADDSWTSEPVITDERGYMLKVQWYGFDPELTFEFDYTNGEVNHMYLDANLIEWSPAGESTVYDNQNEKVKIKENLFRQLKLETGPIPRYEAEKLKIAMMHDVFAINDITYTVEDQPETALSTKNMVTLTAVIVQSTVLGLNTDDIGFDCDSIVTTNDMIDNLYKENGTGQFSLTLKAGYSINQIILSYQDGTGVTFKAGWSAGEDDIVRTLNVPESGFLLLDREVAQSSSVAKTIYCEVGGTNALVNVYIQTIQFTQP